MSGQRIRFWELSPSLFSDLLSISTAAAMAAVLLGFISTWTEAGGGREPTLVFQKITSVILIPKSSVKLSVELSHLNES